MKKIIFIGIITFMSCLVNTEIYGQKTLSLNREANGSFGRYGDCTTGRGICGIDTDNLSDKSTTAKFSIEKENDSIVILKIFIKRISQFEEINILGKAAANFEKSEQMYFKMDVDLPFANTTKIILQLANNYSKIQSGLYPVVKFDSYYMVELKLK
jgi:hypothetical protein